MDFRTFTDLLIAASSSEDTPIQIRMLPPFELSLFYNCLDLARKAFGHDLAAVQPSLIEALLRSLNYG